jgi:hypothetical protein
MSWWQGVRRAALLAVARIVSPQVRRLRVELAVERESMAAVLADFEAETAAMRAAHAQALADRDRQIADLRAEANALDDVLRETRAEVERERRLGNAAWQRVALLRRTTAETGEQLIDLQEQEKEVRT